MRCAMLPLLFIVASSSPSEVPGSCTDQGCPVDVDSDDVVFLQTDAHVQDIGETDDDGVQDIGKATCVDGIGDGKREIDGVRRPGAAGPDLTIKQVRWALGQVGGVTQDQAKERITADSCQGLNDALKNAKIDTLDEFSMFLANVVQESDRMAATGEYNVAEKKGHYDWGVKKAGQSQACPTNGEKGCHGSACSTKCEHHYYGRGYLMTTWRKNYVAASQDVCGSADCLETNPDKLLEKKAAWKSAGYYWKTTIANQWPNGYTMGQTILAINGALECEVTSWNSKAVPKSDTSGVTQLGHARKRFCFYRKIYKFLHAYTPPENDKLCVLTECTEDDCDDCH